LINEPSGGGKKEITSSHRRKFSKESIRGSHNFIHKKAGGMYKGSRFGGGKTGATQSPKLSGMERKKKSATMIW